MNLINLTIIVLLVIFVCLSNIGLVIGFNGEERNTKSNGISHKILKNSADFISSESTVIALALTVFKQQYLSRLAIVCCQTSADRRLIRTAMTQFPTIIITPTTLHRLDRTYFRTGILVVMEECTTKKVFKEGAMQPYINASYHWLFVSKSSEHDASLQFRGIELGFDTSITVAIPEGITYKLLDIYKDDLKDCIGSVEIGRFFLDQSHRGQHQINNWIDAENSPHRSKVNRRIPTGMLVLDPEKLKVDSLMEQFDVLRGDPRVPATYFGMKEIHAFYQITELYNISIIPYFWAQIGYPNESGAYNDMLGALQNGQIELVATKALIVNSIRRTVVDYIHTSCDSFRIGIVYYVGQSFGASTALIRPFSAGIWITILGSAVAGITVLILVSRSESKRGENPADFTVGAAVLIIVGTFSGQGHTKHHHRDSSRAVLAVFLLTGFVLVGAYSAIIVRSLLSAPVQSIRNRADFMRSPLKLAVEKYYHFYKGVFGDTMDDRTRTLYEQKIRPPRGPGYRSLSESFQGVLEQRWAMLTMENNIKLEMTMVTPQQVCRLKFLSDFDYDGILCPIVRKKSSFKNLLSRGLALVQERGLLNREELRYRASEVICLQGNKRQWAPVSFKIIIPAISLLAAGYMVGLFICIAEVLYTYHLFRKRPKFTKNRRTLLVRTGNRKAASPTTDVQLKHYRR